MKRCLSLLLVALMLVAALCGCTPVDKTETAAKMITVQLGGNPETVDPALNSAVDGGNYLLFAFDCLLNIDQDNKVVAGAAEEWSVSEDSLTWTFKIREGLKWSDGSALTAEDFEYSFKRVVAFETGAPYGETVLGMVEGFAEASAEGGNLDALKVEAKDATTLEIKLATPCPYFDKLCAFATLSPVNKATVEANGDAWATAPATYICNGAFYIKEWVRDSYILFAKNPYYRDADRVKLDYIKCLLIEDPNATFSAWESGEADMIKDVPAAQVSVLKANNNPNFYIETILGTYYISLNDSIAPFTDAKVRQALSLAIDRNYVANTLMGGTYAPAPNFMGPGIADWDGSDFYNNANGGATYIDLNDHAGNVAKAKQLLKEAGYENGVGLDAITYSTNDAGYHKIVAQYVQQAWQELGLTVNVEVVEWSSFTPMRRAGDYQISRNGWVMDYNDPSNMLELFVSTNGNNDGKFSNADYDELMAKAAAEKDPETRFGYFHDAEDILMAEAGCIPVAYYTDFWCQNDRITGSWHSPYGYWYFMYADVVD